MKCARPQNSETSALAQRHFNQPEDLFPDSLLDIAPAIWPKAGTIAYEALDSLCIGPLTQAEFKPSWRLAAYILDLEHMGWSFIRRDVVRPGCRTPITEYRLDRTAPRTVAALLQQQKGGA